MIGTGDRGWDWRTGRIGQEGEVGGIGFVTAPFFLRIDTGVNEGGGS